MIVERGAGYGVSVYDHPAVRRKRWIGTFPTQQQAVDAQRAASQKRGVLRNISCSHADVAVQLGHSAGGALVMSTYGHPSEDLARERLKRAYWVNVAALPLPKIGSQMGGSGS
jgi:hypothetical protein